MTNLSRRTNVLWLYFTELIAQNTYLMEKRHHEVLFHLDSMHRCTQLDPFKLKTALICNVYDVDQVKDRESKYYAKVYDLSHQNRCYPIYAVDKEAQRDYNVTERLIEDEIAKVKSEINYYERRKSQLEETLCRLRAGDIKKEQVYV